MPARPNGFGEVVGELPRAAVRSHWGVETSLHWVLDVVAFEEDDCHIRKANAPQNFAILRHIVLNLLKQEQTAKGGVKAKRLKAGWNNAYLAKVLSQVRCVCPAY